MKEYTRNIGMEDLHYYYSLTFDISGYEVMLKVLASTPTTSKELFDNKQKEYFKLLATRQMFVEEIVNKYYGDIISKSKGTYTFTTNMNTNTSTIVITEPGETTCSSGGCCGK